MWIEPANGIAQAGRAEHAPGKAGIHAHPRPRHVSHFIIEILFDVDVGGAQRPGAVDIQCRDAPGQVVAAAIGKKSFRQISVNAQRLAEAEVGIHSQGPVEMRGVLLLLVVEHHSNIGVGQNVAAQARHCEVGGGQAALPALLDIQHPELVASRASRQPGASQNGDRSAGGGGVFAGQPDLPALEEQHVVRRDVVIRAIIGPAAELEDAGIFQEKFALLREQRAEASQVDLLVVGLHL